MSARSIIETTLARYGLESMATWAWDRWLKGDSVEQIMLEIRETKTYQQRFPAMKQLAEEGRAITEEEYMSYEATIRQLVSTHGLPPQIYTNRDYIAELLINDISPSEAQSRMQLAESASLTAPEEYRQAAGELYGLSASEWASIWLEPDRTLPELEKKFAAAAIAGEATIADLGQLEAATAERLVEAGVSLEQARQGFTQVSPSLAAQLPGETSGLGTQTLALGAAGVGDAARQLRQKRQQRIAEFAGGGTFAGTRTGMGIGRPT